MIVGLVIVVGVGAFLVGWMTRHAMARADGETIRWHEVDGRPALYDWAAEKDPPA